MEYPYRNEKFILNNQYKLITEENEYRMSHWVKGFGIQDKDGTDIMTINRSLNLNELEELDANRVTANFEVYPFSSLKFEIVIDLVEKTFICKEQKMLLSELDNFFQQKADEKSAELGM